MTHNFNRRNFFELKKVDYFYKTSKTVSFEMRIQKIKDICTVYLENGTTLKNSIYKFCFSFLFPGCDEN